MNPGCKVPVRLFATPKTTRQSMVLVCRVVGFSATGSVFSVAWVVS